MTGPRDLNSPLPSGKICNADGTATMQFTAFIRRLWERTGYSPGSDANWYAQEADTAILSAQAASVSASLAQSTGEEAQKLAVMPNSSAALALAQEALDVARTALLQARACEANALKALETAQELATLCATTRTARDGTSSDESMTFAVMTRPWPSSHNPS